MKIDTKSRHITPADGNIFVDLGFSPDEAAQLYAESQRAVAAIKAAAEPDKKLDKSN